MPNQDPSNRPDSVSAFDPARLAVLLAKAQQLRDRGEDDFVQRVLDGLSDAERQLYGKLLAEEVAGSLEASLQTEIPTDLGSEPETIDLSGLSDSSDVHGAQTEIPSSSAKASSKARQSSRRRSVGNTTGGDIRMPDRIGKFVIRRELGRGAFGVVYLGYDEELQRQVAVKVSLVSDPQLQERLRVEGAKLAQVESPGIIPVYHIGRTENEKFYIVQKYIEGTTLRRVLRDQSLSPLVAVALMREIAVGLAPAHKIDILHRDLKPDNILIEEGGKAWVADFGLAISENEQVDHRRELAGTPPYMSPEQIRGRIDFLDPRSDIWSLGVMFYELLTGKLPFTGKDRKSLTEQICEMDPRPLHQRAPGLLTESMNDVFLRCCAKKPADRFATVDEFVGALDELAHEGLSDQNINGETALSLGGVSTDQNRFLSTSSQRTAQGSTRLGSTRIGSTRSVGSGRSVDALSSDGAVPVTSNRSLMLAVAAAAFCLSALALVGYQYYPRNWGDAPDHGNNGSKERPWIVGTGEGVTHQTIADAVSAAKAGHFILVEPGTYEQPFLITKPITITGQPPKLNKYPCTLKGTEESIVSVDCSEGEVHIRNFKISGMGHRMKEEFNPIELRSGNLFVKDCLLETETQNCIKVRSGGVLDVQNCEFDQSSEASISAMGSSKISVSSSHFYRSGVEVTGGGIGLITACTFAGEFGIQVAKYPTRVKSLNCKFADIKQRALHVLDGGELEVTGAEIRNSNTGVEVSAELMRDDAPVAGRSGKVSLSGSRLEGCAVALSVIGGRLEASGECLIQGSTIVGLAVQRGTADLNDVTISDSTGQAVLVLDGAVNMRQCIINGSGASAIRLLGGTLSYEGGTIEDFLLHGVEIGEKLTENRPEIQVDLDDIEIRSSRTKKSGLAAFQGKIDLHSVLIEGPRYGILVEAASISDDIGRAENEDSAAQPIVELTATETLFKNLTAIGLVATGNSKTTIDSATSDSLNASKGLDVSVPAVVIVDTREQ